MAGAELHPGEVGGEAEGPGRGGGRPGDADGGQDRLQAQGGGMLGGRGQLSPPSGSGRGGLVWPLL